MALRSFPARYPSRCSICDEMIWEDRSVVYLDDPDAGELVHSLCAEDEGYEVD